MKNVILLLVVLIAFTSAFATMNGDNLLVPKTAVAPVIDGDVDAVWHGVTYTPAKVMVENDTYWDNWYGWFDTFVGLRLMYDDENLYMLYDIWDDLIPGDNYDVANHEYDSMEIYLDGDDSKTEGAYDTIDDIQFRFIYMYEDMGFEEGSMPQYGFGADGAWDGDATITEDLSAGTQFAWSENMKFPGARLEVALNLEAYRLYPEVGTTFGFDLQYNDNDEEGVGPRVGEWKWWSNSGESWRNAAMFGTAEWDDYVANEFLNVPMAETAPTIDGELDEAWAGMPEFSAEVFVTSDGSGESMFNVNDAPFIYDIDLYMDGWEDCWPTFRAMWDADNFYLFLNVEDDVIFTEGNAWEADCLELYFDGDNSKNDFTAGEAYDDNDTQMRWVADNVAVQENTEAVSVLTETGWTYEIAIPFTELNFDPEAGMDFGFEVQIADNDGEEWTREALLRWWSDDNNSWQDASLFGNAYFGGEDVAVENDVTVADEFALEQNYPNPFNPTTNIKYSVATTSNVRLTVYDMLGKQVAELVNDVRPAGSYTVAFDASDLASGMYIYKLQADNNVFTNRMMLIK